MSRLLQELKRRNVFKVAAAYLVAAWVLLQVTDLLAPELELPDWTFRLVLLLLVIGFVPALILAWAYDLTPGGVKRDPEDAESPSTRSVSPAVLAIGIFVIAAFVAGGYWYSGRDYRWATNVAFPEIERLTETGMWESAYRLAREVESRLPENEALADLWPSIGFVTTIETNPSGAVVARRPYGAAGEWQTMGTSPLSDINIPFGPNVVRLELDGRAPIERIVGGETVGSYRLAVRDDPDTWGGAIQPGGFRFDTADSMPEGMVRVPGHRLRVGDDDVLMQDFFIGRYEVTNREYKAFVDAGGYGESRYWEHAIVVDGETLTHDAAMALFIDTSGRPGPSTWTGGTYPDGQEEFPVSGVSWYEAAAYAAFAGRELPTVYHWRRAYAPALLSHKLNYANVDSRSAAPVGSNAGIGWTGTYDLVGNVREWCSNAVGDQRVIVGGSFDEPAYQVHQSVLDPSSLPALNRHRSNGIRLAHSVELEDVEQRLRAPVAVTNIPEIDQPVSDDVYQALLGHYQYDRLPLDPVIEETIESRHWTRYKVSVVSDIASERLPLYLYIPNAPATNYQAVVYWPTITALFRESIDQLGMQLDFVLRNGRAVILPVYDGILERRRPEFPDWASTAGRDLVIQAVKDMRRAIDYLESRPDIDNDAIAYYGFSWGGRLGAITLSVEPRIKVGILNQAGLQHLSVPETSVLNFLPRVTTPVLQFNGRYDTDFRYESSARPFFELLGTPEQDKRHEVGNTGHFVDRNVVTGMTLDWLDKHLGAPN
jgi:predicted esterase